MFGIITTVAYIGLPIVILRRVASISPLARYYAHVGLYLGAMTGAALWGVVIGAVMGLTGNRYDVNYYVARSFYFIASNLLDIEVVVEGEEHLQNRPVVLMGNHQSMLDILMLGKVFPKQTSIMAKKEIQWTPMGPFMTLSGAVFVDRGNSAHAQQSLAAAGEAMKLRKTSLWIFPEGTRTLSKDTYMKPFKKGGFHLAVQSGVPILPVVFENYWWLYHQSVFGSGTIKVRVLPPIETKNLTTADIPDLVLNVQGKMMNALREISTHTGSSTIEPSTDAQSSADAPLAVDKPDEKVAPAAAVVSDIAHSESSSSISSAIDVKTESEGTGTETEEDEGWGLVGRPENKSGQN